MGHRCGNLRILRIRDVVFSVHQEAMDLRMKCILNLSRIAGKDNLPPVHGDFIFERHQDQAQFGSQALGAG